MEQRAERRIFSWVEAESPKVLEKGKHVSLCPNKAPRHTLFQRAGKKKTVRESPFRSPSHLCSFQVIKKSKKNARKTRSKYTGTLKYAAKSILQ